MCGFLPAISSFFPPISSSHSSQPALKPPQSLLWWFWAAPPLEQHRLRTFCDDGHDLDLPRPIPQSHEASESL